MNRGQHRRANAIIEFLKKKPVYLLAVAMLAIVGVEMNSHTSSFALQNLDQWGSGSPGVPPSEEGQITTQTDSISGGTELYVISPSPVIAPSQQGSSGVPPTYARAKFYGDQNGHLTYPDGETDSFWNYHFDVVKGNTGQTLDSHNGYEEINSSLVSNFVNAADGYIGSYYQSSQNIALEQQFDTKTTNFIEQNKYAQFANSAYGAGKFQTFDLPSIIGADGGGFSGVYAGPGATEGPIFNVTFAPEVKAVIPSTQNITKGSMVKFYNSVAIESYNTKYHWEYDEIYDSNGQLVSTSFNYPGNYGTGPIAYNGNPMTEIYGGFPYGGNTKASWLYYTDGAGVSTWGSTSGAKADTFKAPSTEGTYTLVPYVADYFGRITAGTPVSFSVGKGASSSGITLSETPASPATVQVSSAVTLTATVTTAPPKGDQWYIQIADLNGNTINSTQKSASSSTGQPLSFTVSANSQSPLSNETFEAYLIDVTNNSHSKTSNNVYATWQSGGGGGGGGGGVCPAPYDNNEYWQSNGNGNETFYWTYNVPTWVPPVYRTNAKGKKILVRAGYCNDVTQQMHQYYPGSLTQGQISGLSYDPGSPGNMWLPESASAWGQQNSYANPTHFSWFDLNSQHGWDGFENGGPSASQISGSYYINGTTYNSYGTGQGSTPWVWARPNSGFGFRIMWQTSPHSLPTSGTVTYTMTNPDGSSTTWRKRLIVNGDTLNTQGTSMPGLNQPPPDSSEFVSAWSGQIPKTVGSNKELAAWSLSGNTNTALAEGAHISVTISVNTQNAGTVTLNVPSMVVLYNYPAWMFNKTKSVTVGGQTYTGTTPALDGQP